MSEEALVTQQQINEYRARIRAGEELTEDELRKAWATLRQARNLAASMATTKSRSSSPKAPVRSTAELTALFKDQQVE